MLLEVRDLRTHFTTDLGVYRSVDGVSFTVDRGETVGLVGESGCGKSVTAMSLVRLVPEPPATLSGQVLLDGRDLLKLSKRELQQVRGGDIAYIFQEPMTSLNPVYTVGDQIVEAILLHQDMDYAAAREAAVAALEAVGIPAPRSRIDDYPHQLSGGMKQRVMIAMALACNPALLVADEPTTALDVTIQAQILELLAALQRSRGLAVLLITHDLGVVAEITQQVVVMYAGKVVEKARTPDLFARPTHPYTQSLLRSLPELAPPGSRLATIDGMVPSPLDFPSGCRFRTRCPRATAACAEDPPLIEVGDGHQAWCANPGPLP